MLMFFYFFFEEAINTIYFDIDFIYLYHCAIPVSILKIA